MSNKTTHLLAGYNAGSKFDKAKELSVNIIDEEGVIAFLKERGIFI